VNKKVPNQKHLNKMSLFRDKFIPFITLEQFNRGWNILWKYGVNEMYL